MDIEKGRLFAQIRPWCVSLSEVALQEPSEAFSGAVTASLKKLNASLNRFIIEESGLDAIEVDLCGQLDLVSPKMADYIMFPISELLKRPNLNDTELELILAIIKTLVITCWSNHFDVNLFNQLVPLVVFLIGGKPNEFDAKNASDETLMNGIDIIKGLLISVQNGSGNNENALKSQEMIPSMAHLVSVLLNLSIHRRDTNVKLKCLKSLNLMYHLINDGDILSLMFPGNVSTFAKLVKSNPNSIVIGEMFVTFTTLTNLVFNDLDLGVVENPIELSELERLTLDEPKMEFVEIPEFNNAQIRTTKWLKATLPQFEKGLQIILNISDTNVQKVYIKDPLFQFNIKMVRNCFLSCSTLIHLNFKSLAQITQFDSKLIEEVYESLIYCFHGDGIQIQCLKIMEDQLANMSYVLSSPNSDTISHYVNHLNLLANVIIEVGNSDFDLSIKSLIGKLIINVSKLVKSKSLRDLKVNSRKLIEPVESQMILISNDYIKGKIDIESSKDNNLFEGIFTKDIESQFKKLFRSFSKLKNFDSLQLDDFDNKEFESSVLLWILTETTSNINTCNKEPKMDDYLDFGSLEDEENSESSSVTRSDSQIVQLHYQMLDKSLENITSTSEFCVITCLRSIDSNLKFFGSDFKTELIDVLYPLVICLSSNSERIRYESQITITNVAMALYEGSIPEMLKDNMDYLIDSIGNNLLSESITPKILIILNVMIKIGSVDIVSDLKDIINALFTLLDLHYGYNSLVGGIFLIFNEIVNQIYQKYMDKIDFESLESVEDDIDYHGMWNLQNLDDVKAFVKVKGIVSDDLNFHEENSEEELRKPKILEIDSDDESDSDNEDDDANEESIPQSEADNDGDGGSDENKWNSPIEPRVYEVIENIFQYGERLMQIASSNNNIIILRLLKRITPLLATQKSRFMPLAVKMWDKLCFNLENANNSQANLNVINVTIQNMIEIVKYLNTFMARRFIDLFKLINSNRFVTQIILKKYAKVKPDTKILINSTSTSINMNLETFNKICELFIIGLKQMGRFLPNDIALSIIKITIFYDNEPTHYGYFDNHVAYLLTHNKRNQIH